MHIRSLFALGAIKYATCVAEAASALNIFVADFVCWINYDSFIHQFRTVESYKMNTIDRVTLWHKNDLNWYDDEVSRFAFGWLISPREPIALHAVIEVNQAAPRGFACDRERLISTHSPIKQLKRRVVPKYPWRFSHRSVSIDGLSESERDDSPTGMRRVW